jgi:hypothetical protein
MKIQYYSFLKETYRYQGILAKIVVKNNMHLKQLKRPKAKKEKHQNYPSKKKIL